MDNQDKMDEFSMTMDDFFDPKVETPDPNPQNSPPFPSTEVKEEICEFKNAENSTFEFINLKNEPVVKLENFSPPNNFSAELSHAAKDETHQDSPGDVRINLEVYEPVSSGRNPCCCNECGVFFSGKRELSRHLIYEHLTPDLPHHTCPLCPYKHQYPSKIRIHWSRVHPGPCPVKVTPRTPAKHNLFRYKCARCTYKNQFPSQIKIHWRKHHSGSCRIIPLNTCTESKTKNNMFKCAKCQFKNIFSSKVKAHWSETHSGPCEMVPLTKIHSMGDKRYKCGLCWFSKDYLCYIKKHWNNSHSGPFQYVQNSDKAPKRTRNSRARQTDPIDCDDDVFDPKIVQKIYSQNSTDKQNEKMRLVCGFNLTEIKQEPSISKYSCNECDISFPQKHELLEHIQSTHLAERYSCPLCSYKHQYPQGIRIHWSRTHHGPCPTLPKYHSRMDNADKNKYQCALCPFKSHVTSRLRKHWGREHSGSGPCRVKPLNNCVEAVHSQTAFKCAQCDFTDNFSYKIKDHWTKTHSGTCEIIPVHKSKGEYGFNTSGALYRYQCGLCEYKQDKSNCIKKHWERSHIGPCQIIDLNKSGTSTTNIKPVANYQLKCGLCTFKHTNLARLKRHWRPNHSGPFRYSVLRADKDNSKSNPSVTNTPNLNPPRAVLPSNSKEPSRPSSLNSENLTKRNEGVEIKTEKEFFSVGEVKEENPSSLPAPPSPPPPPPVYSCEECPLSFSEKHHLSRHVANDHLSPLTRYSCPACDFGHQFLSRLRRHWDVKHYGPFPIPMRSYTQPHSVRTAPQLSNKRRFECAQCPYSHYFASGIKCHWSRVHTGPCQIIPLGTTPKVHQTDKKNKPKNVPSEFSDPDLGDSSSQSLLCSESEGLSSLNTVNTSFLNPQGLEEQSSEEIGIKTEEVHLVDVKQEELNPLSSVLLKSGSATRPSPLSTRAEVLSTRPAPLSALPSASLSTSPLDPLSTSPFDPLSPRPAPLSTSPFDPLSPHSAPLSTLPSAPLSTFPFDPLSTRSAPLFPRSALPSSSLPSPSYVYSCNDCSLSFSRKSDLTQHISTNHLHHFFSSEPHSTDPHPKPINLRCRLKDNRKILCRYQCALCPFKEAYPSRIRVHWLRAHSGPCRFLTLDEPICVNWYTCGRCDFTHNVVETVRVHWAENHEGPCLVTTSNEKKMKKDRFEKFECGECSFRHYSKTSIQFHWSQKHKGEVRVIDLDLQVTPSTSDFHSAPPLIPENESQFLEWDGVKKITDGDERKKFTCNFCGKIRRGKKKIELHMKNSHLTKYECSFCSFKSYYKKYMELHCSTEHGVVTCYKKIQPNSRADVEMRKIQEAIFKIDSMAMTATLPCYQCSKILPSKTELKNHVLKDHLQVQRYVCLYCNSAHTNSNDIRLHNFSMHPTLTPKFVDKMKLATESQIKKMITCNFCEHSILYSKMKQHLSARLNCKSKGKTLCCTVQRYIAEVLDKHWAKEHPQCKFESALGPPCKEGYVSAQSLFAHYMHYHVAEGQCVKCGFNPLKGFTPSTLCVTLWQAQTLREAVYKVEVVISVGTPFQCFLCPSRFFSPVTFRSHVYLKHLGVERFRCGGCEYGAYAREEVERHGEQAGHRGEVRDVDPLPRWENIRGMFKCKDCEELFFRSDDLKRHEYEQRGRGSHMADPAGGSDENVGVLKQDSRECQQQDASVKDPMRRDRVGDPGGSNLGKSRQDSQGGKQVIYLRKVNVVAGSVRGPMIKIHQGDQGGSNLGKLRQDSPQGSQQNHLKIQDITSGSVKNHKKGSGKDSSEKVKKNRIVGNFHEEIRTFNLLEESNLKKKLCIIKYPRDHKRKLDLVKGSSVPGKVTDHSLGKTPKPTLNQSKNFAGSHKDPLGAEGLVKSGSDSGELPEMINLGAPKSPEVIEIPEDEEGESIGVHEDLCVNRQPPAVLRQYPAQVDQKKSGNSQQEGSVVNSGSVDPSLARDPAESSAYGSVAEEVMSLLDALNEFQ